MDVNHSADARHFHVTINSDTETMKVLSAKEMKTIEGQLMDKEDSEGKISK